MYISRQQLLKASRRGPWSLLRIVRIVPLERMARHLGVEACGLRAAVSAMGHGGSARWMADHGEAMSKSKKDAVGGHNTKPSGWDLFIRS